MRDSWIGSLRAVIRTAFRDLGKGEWGGKDGMVVKVNTTTRNHIRPHITNYNHI